MNKDSIYITELSGVQIPLHWNDLHQLKKDILWTYFENTGNIKDAYVPRETLQLKYWEYLTLQGKDLEEGEQRFYLTGVLVILYCMIAEYIDTIAGDQGVFYDVQLNEVNDYVNGFNPTNENESKLKDVILQGLEIAMSMKKVDLHDTFGFQHPSMESFYDQSRWVDDTFVKFYLG